MLTREEEVDAYALRKRGWSISAIARHLGRDRKTVRRHLNGEREAGTRQRSDGWFSKFAPYIAARFDDDKHLWTTVLYRELTELGFSASYQTLTREIRAGTCDPRAKSVPERARARRRSRSTIHRARRCSSTGSS